MPNRQDRRRYNGKAKKGRGMVAHKLRQQKELRPSKRLAREGLGMTTEDVYHSDLSIEESSDLTADQKSFLAAFSECGSVFVAAKIAGINRSAHRKWSAKSEEYVEAFEQARLQSIDKLEQEARRRAAEGVKRFKFYKGEPIINPETGKPYYELEYSDALLVCLLKAYAPEKFKDRIEQNISGNMQAQVSVQALLTKLPIGLRKQLLLALKESNGSAPALPPPDDWEEDDSDDDQDSDEEE